MHYHSEYDAQGIAKELRRWNRQHAEPLREFIQLHTNDRDPDRRLRIGYVSPDFLHHVVGQSLLPLLQKHDRQQFEITCYAHVLRPDAMTRQLQENAHCWRNIVGLTDEEVAKQIRDDRIDILVDLSLHTPNNRLLVFARKPAPVQVTYLAYCGTSGMSAMDYRLSDPYLDPLNTDLSCYSEKTVRLPQSYWCYRPAGPGDEPSASPAARNGFVTFGCLNNFAKVSSAALELWGRIMMAEPSSRMIIHALPGTHLDRVVHQLDRGGVAKDRLRFVGKQPWMGYTQTYSQIDIILDAFPFAGGITTCDALWMGVPVVSLSGVTAVGRGGRSILSNIGMAELLANSQEEYAQIASALARDIPRLNNLHATLRHNMEQSPLMDAGKFALNVEAAYRSMWQTWCRGG
jgi:predicted O-linked N-acetylglucosamine transferase (SPINDLY family)